MLPTSAYLTFAETRKNNVASNKHEIHQKSNYIKGRGERSLSSRVRGYFLFIRYSFMALAAFLPMPIALITVAAPVATSPPA